MRAIIAEVAELTGVSPEGPQKASHRVIADHLRASVFLTADGVLPSNEGRGYVLRRIMRRAMRHAQLLGARDPLMHQLVPILVREMGRAYPEIVRAEPLAAETLLLEEKRFRRTLERGIAILDEESAGLVSGASFPGDVAFKLYDTYGFPLDLTEDALRGRGIHVDTTAFNAAMERQRADARAAWQGSGDAATDTVWFALRERDGATEFLGYDTESAEGVVQALVRDGAEVQELKAGEQGLVLVNQTPFYAESGGQVGDTGVLVGEDVRATVINTQKKLGDLFVHEVQVAEGVLTRGTALALEVDHTRRAAVRANHSATHLLHEALRRVLGDHVAQKGSMVAADRLRFDFSHPKPLSANEVAEVEEIANAYVLRNEPVVTRLMGQEEAIESGARALFGEKYGDEVRVVSDGDGPVGTARPYSVELCGGTHVSRTGDIGLVSLVSETAVGAGVRRIEALTAHAARHHLNAMTASLQGASAALKVPVADVEARVAILVEDRRKLERELADARRKLAMGGSGADSGPQIIEVNGTRYLAIAMSGADPKDLKAIVDQGKTKIGSGIVAVANTAADGKGALVVGVTADLTGRFDSQSLVRIGVEILGGKGGGGRADMAQGGGPDGAQAEAALSAIQAAIAAVASH